MKTKKQITLIVAAGLIIVGITYALVAGGERLKGSFVEGKKIPVATDIKTIRYHDNEIGISWQKPKYSTVTTYKLFRKASSSPFTEEPTKSLSDSKWEELIEEIDGTTVTFKERSPKEKNKKWAYSLVGLDGTKYVGSILIVPMDSIMPIKDDNGAGGTADLFWTSTKYNGKTVPHEIYRSKLGVTVTAEDAKTETEYLPKPKEWGGIQWETKWELIKNNYSLSSYYDNKLTSGGYSYLVIGHKDSQQSRAYYTP